MRLIDTSVCVAILKGTSSRVPPKFRAAIASGIAVSSISAAELYYGLMRSSDPVRERRALDDLFGSVNIIPFGTKAAEASGVIRSYLERRGEIIGQFDLLIAAHAVAESAILVTGNTGEFSRVPTLVIENWLK